MIKNWQHEIEEAFNAHHKAMYYWVQKFVSTREDAEDIVADVFVRLWKKGQASKPENMKSFLYAAAKNAALDFLRSRDRKIKHEPELIRILSESDDSDFAASEVKAAVLTAIFNEIENLPRKVRTVFKMAYLEGLGNEEIASKLNIKNQTVRNFKYRAAQELRLKLLKSALVSLLFFLYHEQASFHQTASCQAVPEPFLQLVDSWFQDPTTLN